MYHMKNIISFEEETILPKCMYTLKNPIDPSKKDTEINISEQVIKFLKKMPNNQLHELEDRQDKLLHKLDLLYERIKSISSLCSLKTQQDLTTKITDNTIKTEEIVIVLNPDNLPWFLNIFLKTGPLNVSWHIHSTVPQAKVPKIEAFFKKFQSLYKKQSDAKVNLRLIFKGESAVPELKNSTLGVPILGIVNILRYLCLNYLNIAPYDYSNYEVDGLLDICYQIETSADKNKEALIAKIFIHSNNWIHKNNFSIVDLAIFNVIKQLQNGNKYVPKQWLNDCEKKCL